MPCRRPRGWASEPGAGGGNHVALEATQENLANRENDVSVANKSAKLALE